ncbi:Aste57867_14736 [Aphanomyces stellatus]|uniref:Aste57867_14736 protein n=1 Tax=Aphanomyces stellatus TaxID=120398 RepID=A0A485L1G4_9STRA|nr:hypothetical protein As57867_014681 [Aphanomyces stellatus]VFT91554.1 Aste57867_14736 [Aphanomyces stellatus]
MATEETKTLRDVADAIAGFVAGGVVVVGLICYTLYIRRKRRREMQLSTPMLSPQRQPDSHEQQHYTHKTALWNDSAFDPTQPMSPSAPRQSWSPSDNGLDQPSAPIFSPASVPVPLKMRNVPSAPPKEDLEEIDMKVEASDVKRKASAAPKSEPSMAPPFTAQDGGRNAKMPFEAESTTGNARVCIVCFDAPQDAACVSCGHNALCMTCAKHLLKQTERSCLVCRQCIRHVMRIYHG